MLVTEIDEIILSILWEYERIEKKTIKSGREVKALYELYVEYVKSSYDEVTNLKYFHILESYLEDRNNKKQKYQKKPKYKQPKHKQNINKPIKVHFGAALNEPQKINESEFWRKMWEAEKHSREQAQLQQNKFLLELSESLKQQNNYMGYEFSEMRKISKENAEEILDKMSNLRTTHSKNIWEVPVKDIPKELWINLCSNMKRSIFSIATAPFYTVMKGLDLIFLTPLSDASKFWYNKFSIVWGTGLIIIIGVNALNVYYWAQTNPEEWESIKNAYNLHVPVGAVSFMYDYSVGNAQNIYDIFMKDQIQNAFEISSKVITENYDNVKDIVTEKVKETANEAASNAISGVTNSMTSTVSTLFNGLSSIATNSVLYTWNYFSSPYT